MRVDDRAHCASRSSITLVAGLLEERVDQATSDVRHQRLGSAGDWRIVAVRRTRCGALAVLSPTARCRARTGIAQGRAATVISHSSGSRHFVVPALTVSGVVPSRSSALHLEQVVERELSRRFPSRAIAEFALSPRSPALAGSASMSIACSAQWKIACVRCAALVAGAARDHLAFIAMSEPQIGQCAGIMPRTCAAVCSGTTRTTSQSRRRRRLSPPCRRCARRGARLVGVVQGRVGHGDAADEHRREAVRSAWPHQCGRC